MTAKRTVQLQALIGVHVCDVNGERVGPIEEVAATMQDGEMVIDCFVVGMAGFASRMSIGSSLHWIGRLLGAKARRGHVIPWDQLDLSDPKHPVTTCARDDLKRRPPA